MESYVECGKEVLFGDVVDACPHHPLDLLAVCRRKRAEISNIKRLEDVRQVGRYTDLHFSLLLLAGAAAVKSTWCCLHQLVLDNSMGESRFTTLNTYDHHL